MDLLLKRILYVYLILFHHRASRTEIQLIRYGIVGGAAFLVDFASLVAITEWVGFDYLVAAVIAFIAGLAVNYLLSVRWVFGSGRDHKKEFTIYMITGLIGLLLNEFIMWFFTDSVGTHYTVSKIVSTVLVFLWNFFSRKVLLPGED